MPTTTFAIVSGKGPYHVRTHLTAGTTNRYMVMSNDFAVESILEEIPITGYAEAVAAIEALPAQYPEIFSTLSLDKPYIR